MRYVTNSLTIILSFLAVFLEEKYMSDYRIQVIGFLILIYLGLTFFRRKYKRNTETFSSATDIFIVNSTVILLILATGAIASPIFFLTYFLCFGITFVFEPITVFIFAIGVIIIFIPEAMQNQELASYVKLISILVIAPLAFFFGKEYKDREKLKKQVDKTTEEAKKISKEINEVIDTETTINPVSNNKLKDALQRIKKLQK